MIKRHALALGRDAFRAKRKIGNAYLAAPEVNYVAVYIARLSLIWSHNPHHHH
jgi:hypothetical protein